MLAGAVPVKINDNTRFKKENLAPKKKAGIKSNALFDKLRALRKEIAEK